MDDDSLLEVRKLTVQYGGIKAVREVDLDVAEREIVALVGANGAGKTSVLKAIAGGVRHRGEVKYQGQLLPTSLRPHHRVKRGMMVVPEGRRILAGMTVRENLLVGAHCHGWRASPKSEVDQVLELFPILRARLKLKAGVLSGGEQQMLAIGRALMSRPKLLMLDEPSLGLAPLIVSEIMCLLERIRSEGVTILVVEQKARQILEVADRVYVMNVGRITFADASSRLLDQTELWKTFMGVADT